MTEGPRFLQSKSELIQSIYAKKDGSLYRIKHAADRVEIVEKRALELASCLDVTLMD